MRSLQDILLAPTYYILTKHYFTYLLAVVLHHDPQIFVFHACLDFQASLLPSSPFLYLCIICFISKFTVWHWF